MSNNVRTWVFMCVCVLILTYIIVVGVLLGWYKAGVQTAVYERQGVHMTQFEVFIGAKPITRNMVVTEK